MVRRPGRDSAAEREDCGARLEEEEKEIGIRNDPFAL
jgi:hypothetical protein